MLFSSVSQGTQEARVYDFKDLPLSGATKFYNKTTGLSYSYNAIKRELISYNTVIVAKQKALWIKQIGMGRAMWQESSANKLGNLSLIQNVVQILGKDGLALENTWNELNYLDLAYNNLQASMPNSSLALLCSPSSSCSRKALLSLSTSGLIATNSSLLTILFNNASSLSLSTS